MYDFTSDVPYCINFIICRKIFTFSYVKLYIMMGGMYRKFLVYFEVIY